MFNITGEKVKVWVNTIEGRNGTFQTFAVSISKKVDNEYLNKSVKLLVGRDVWKPDHVENGTFIDFEGFPTLDIYTDRNGNERREVAIFATKVEWNRYAKEGNSEHGEVDGFAQQEIDIPF